MRALDPDGLVLVVDDDPAIQQLFTALLRKRGIRAEVVGDGEVALLRLRNHEYAAILLDLMLPRTDGFEVIRHLQSWKPHVLDRVIVVTAASERSLQTLDSTTVRKVLRKPFDIDELISEVRTCMDQSAGARASRNDATV